MTLSYGKRSGNVGVGESRRNISAVMGAKKIPVRNPEQHWRERIEFYFKIQVGGNIANNNLVDFDPVVVGQSGSVVKSFPKKFQQLPAWTES